MYDIRIIIFASRYIEANTRLWFSLSALVWYRRMQK